MKYLLPFLFALLLSACATPPPKHSGSVDAERHQQRLNALTHWSLSGKLAYRGPEERFSANLNWQQWGPDYRFRLSTFIGTSLMDMQRRGKSVALTLDEQTYRHRHAGTLLENLTGWPIPVEQLPHWIKGSSMGAIERQISDNGLLQRLQSSTDWQVTYDDYRQLGDYVLPYSLRLTHQNHLIKIRINQWQPIDDNHAL
ncbi:Outer-membrane lipoprotein LolB [Saliniradius amylolyticus]|uniref:Outer-membrane lipoprotein LolB n=1 Tax=Saliniradius amylolyticus TaxID=2183582 RepID=A0A2S2E1M9_9ALTE|nr:lipoprotein insertase outer membrane protein LolB [Saliniradius amylolyticus]AWL11499.1 Outer-membrane lipoprotein LolB [Saliniradius amylolyticus]